MKFGEIYICRFPFTSGAASKARPALVLFDLGQDVLICRITSAASATPLDITIADWSSAEARLKNESMPTPAAILAKMALEGSGIE